MITFILYLVNTVLLIIPLWIQFIGIARSPENDGRLHEKVGFFVLDLSMMAAMWLCYYRVRDAAWFFFLIAILVNIWAYIKK